MVLPTQVEFANPFRTTFEQFIRYMYDGVNINGILTVSAGATVVAAAWD